MSKSLFAIASAAVIAALSPRDASADTFAYIANAGSNDVSVFHVEPSSGAVKAVETVPFPGIEKPGSSTPLAVSPDHRFLLSGVRSHSYTVLSFAIDAASGHLTFVDAVRSPTAWPISPPTVPESSCSAPPMAATRSRSIRLARMESSASRSR